jgi:rhodanese-related sulfurtransferase
MSTPRTGRTPAIEPDEAVVLLGGDALMIDVRDEHEWAAGHAPHSIHIPLDEVSASTPFTTRTRRVIVVSRSGRRAERAVTHLRTAGVDAVVLHGGLRAWVEAGGDLVGDGGHGPHIAAPRRAGGGTAT